MTQLPGWHSAVKWSKFWNLFENLLQIYGNFQLKFFQYLNLRDMFKNRKSRKFTGSFSKLKITKHKHYINYNCLKWHNIIQKYWGTSTGVFQLMSPLPITHTAHALGPLYSATFLLRQRSRDKYGYVLSWLFFCFIFF